jgi:hypothetical protein
MCKPIEDYKSKGATEAQVAEKELLLGNSRIGGPKLFYPGHEPYRYCEKYIALDV